MRSVVLDELARLDMEKLAEHLAQTLVTSSLPEVFWLELPPDLLAETQRAHADCCGPHRLAVVLGEEEVRLELLVRSKTSLRCECTAYATKAQRDFGLRYLDKLIDDLGLST